MKEKYKYMFMKYLYNKLDLKQIENNLIVGGIKDQDLESKEVSRYFKVINEIDEGNLTGTLLEKYNYYFSLDLDILCSPKMEQEIFNFINETYKLLMFRKKDINYLYYGPINYKYMAPSDSIVLGFYYQEFDLDEKDFRKKHTENEILIADNLNYIQSVLGPKQNMKVATIKYNEVYDKINKYSLKL